MTRKTELLFIDPGVSDIPTLLGGLRPEVEAILLDARRPAARQIAEALRHWEPTHIRHCERSEAIQRPAVGDFDAIHIIAHGSPGRVSFASDQWSAATLSRDSDDLAAIGRALGADGELRLWCCETGRGAAGEAFVAGLFQEGRTSVRAAAGPVGASQLGGEWRLPVGDGSVDACLPITEQAKVRYAALLGMQITVSGQIPHGPTTRNMTYFVFDAVRKAVVGNITLPDACTFANAFRLQVAVPASSGTFDVGLFDAAGAFKSAGFNIELPQPPIGAMETAR